MLDKIIHFSIKNKFLHLRLPTSSGEKVTLGLTCFVAFSVFMLMVAEKVPATSDTVPIIGKKICINLNDEKNESIKISLLFSLSLFLSC